MGKLGFSKKTIHDLVHEETVAHAHVPGRAYEVADPVAKLIHTHRRRLLQRAEVLRPQPRPTPSSMAELLTTGKIASTIVDEQGLTEQAREVIETATAVANGETPEDLLVVAAWARDPQDGLRLRTTPQILLALAAAPPEDPAVRGPLRHGRHAAGRRDPPGLRRLPPPVPGRKDSRHTGCPAARAAQGAGRRPGPASDYELLKYNGDGPPDVRRRAEDGRRQPQAARSSARRPAGRCRKAMFEYLVNGTVVEDAPAILKRAQGVLRHERTSRRSRTADIEAAGLTWENVVSPPRRLAGGLGVVHPASWARWP